MLNVHASHHSDWIHICAAFDSIQKESCGSMTDVGCMRGWLWVYLYMCMYAVRRFARSICVLRNICAEMEKWSYNINMLTQTENRIRAEGWCNRYMVQRIGGCRNACTLGHCEYLFDLVHICAMSYVLCSQMWYENNWNNRFRLVTNAMDMFCERTLQIYCCGKYTEIYFICSMNRTKKNGEET